ncbi:MAG: extracellular solute-binding protein, partial [Clostridiaceae bacterium]|nr:extracellular solute-binding protein [Clostridiaceae bacterium]
MRRKLSAVIALMLSASCFLTGCQTSVPSPGDIEGYDAGEEYLSIWVHTIEDTDEGRCYKESVQQFNEAYNGKYFADIEFIPRNDSGGGYSDKINASVMSGGLPDVITVDGPNVAAYAVNNIIQPLAPL